MRRPAFLEAGLVLLLLAPWAYLVWRHRFLCDDAYISFRYADFWASGRGLRFNPGEQPPVEGYSNFLWVAVCALVRKLGGEIALWAPRLSALCGALLILGVFRVLRRLGAGRAPAFWATAFVALHPATAIWSTGGLETMPFALLFFVLVERLLLLPGGPAAISGALVALLLALMRTEAIAWPLVLAPIAWLSHRSDGRRAGKAMASFLGLLLATYAIYYSIRYAYFGRPFANTVYAKSGGSWEFYERGLDYVLVHWLTFLTPLLLVPAGVSAVRSGRARGAALLLITLGVHAYAVAAGGDFMAMGRLLVPSIPLQALLLGFWWQRFERRTLAGRVTVLGAGALTVTIGLLPLFHVSLVPRSWRKPLDFRLNTNEFRSEIEQWEFMVRNTENRKEIARALGEIAGPGDSLVVTAVGAIGYYTDLYLYDKAGLVNAEVAEREARKLASPGHDKTVGYRFFRKYRPDFLRVELVQSRDPEVAVLAEAKSFREGKLAREYAPGFRILDEGDEERPSKVVFFVRRVPEGTPAEQVWDEFDRDVRKDLRALLR